MPDMKRLFKLLMVILGIIVAACALILVCASNPALKSTLGGITGDIAKKREIEKQRKAAEEEAAAAATAKKPVTGSEESKDEAATGSSASDQAAGDEAGSGEEQETAHPYVFNKSYEDFVNEWDNSLVSDAVLEDKQFDDFVQAFLNTEGDTVFPDGTYPVGRSHLLTVQPDIIEIEDDGKAQEIIDNTDKGEIGVGLEFDPLFYPYYHMLNDKGQTLYRQLYANAMAQNKTFAPVVKAKSKEIENAFSCLLNDHPELFWVDTSYYYEYDHNGDVIQFNFDFYKQFPNITAARDTFENTAEGMVAGARSLPTDYEKELYVHDLINYKLSYKYNPLDQSAYSSIVQDKTVCAGYARCFQYLCQKLGIPCYNCTGWGGNERHAWNIILLDDGYHNVDCTWDDSLRSYDYFNLSDAENDSHRRMDYSVYLPPCVSSQYRPESSGKPAKNISPVASADTKIVTTFTDDGKIQLSLQSN